MRYRRAKIAGATYFFTVNLENRSSRLLIERIDDLRAVVRQVRHAHPFDILAWMVLPEYIHALWRLPEDDADYSLRWSLIKAGFSRRLPKMEPISNSRGCKCERGIWQRRFWEHLIRNETDLRQHVEYIHYNPVRHGYVGCVRDWPFSTFHYYVRQGLLNEDWGGGV